MDIDTNAEEENSRRVQVRFITKLKPPLKVAPTCHNPIFTPGIFSGVGRQNEAARTKSA
jgi:hypothetical protein